MNMGGKTVLAFYSLCNSNGCAKWIVLLFFLVPQMNEWENTEGGELSMCMCVPEKIEALEICAVFPLRLLDPAFSCQ